MKHWRFKYINTYLPRIVEAEELKDIDNWWRFKTRVEDFNNTRNCQLFISYVLVFDESMSAFILRLVNLLPFIAFKIVVILTLLVVFFSKNNDHRRSSQSIVF